MPTMHRLNVVVLSETIDMKTSFIILVIFLSNCIFGQNFEPDYQEENGASLNESSTRKQQEEFYNLFPKQTTVEDYALEFKSDNRINDYTKHLSEPVLKELTEMTDSIYQNLGWDCRMTFIDSLNGFKIHELAKEMATPQWYTYDVLILVSMQEEGVYMQTSGAITQHLSDKILQSIVNQNLIYNLKNKAYSSGLRDTISAINQRILKRTTNPLGPMSYTLIGIMLLGFVLYIIYDFKKIGGGTNKQFGHRNHSSTSIDGYHSGSSYGGYSDGGGVSDGGAGGSFGDGGGAGD